MDMVDANKPEYTYRERIDTRAYSIDRFPLLVSLGLFFLGMFMID